MAKKHFFSFLFILITALMSAQRPKSDTIYTAQGNLIIQPILHASLTIQFHGKTIYIDPSADITAFNGLPNPDIIMITDIHGDHLNINTLSKLVTKDATFIVPPAVADKLPLTYHHNLKTMQNGDSLKIENIYVKAIPMYNLPESSNAKHPKGRGNGYVLTLGQKNIYISGDTEDIIEMRNLKNIDIAFVCMNLPYTMDIYQAASAVLDFKPKIIYPYHYRGKPNFSDIAAFKTIVDKKKLGIDVRLRNWYPVYQ